MNTEIEIPLKLPPLVQQILNRYLCLELGGKCVPCPYWINQSAINPFLWFNPAFSGKGTPAEITAATIKLANHHHLDLNSSTIGSILRFIQRHNLGVDCSGFAYQLLNAFDLTASGTGLASRLTRTPTWHPFGKFRDIRFKINAAYLTGLQNAFPISEFKDIRPGDMIRCKGDNGTGKHIMIILQSTPKHLIYAHSSHLFTKIKGVHLQQITITHPNLTLDHQQWHEPTITGESYGFLKIHPSEGDGLFRLKIWNYNVT